MTSIFTNSFQGGPSFEVFTAQGSNPLSIWKISAPNAVRKVLDKGLKGNIIICEGGASNFIQIPKDEKKNTLALVQQFLVFQILLPQGQSFGVELSITDTAKNKRRIHLSTAFKEVSVNPLHVKIPLNGLKRGVWLNLCFDLVDIVASNFKGQFFRSLDLLLIRPFCYIRRIFTLKNMSSAIDLNYADDIPKTHSFPVGVDNETQVINMESVYHHLEEEQVLEKENIERIKSKKSETNIHIAFGQRFPQKEVLPLPSNGKSTPTSLPLSRPSNESRNSTYTKTTTKLTKEDLFTLTQPMFKTHSPALCSPGALKDFHLPFLASTNSSDKGAMLRYSGNLSDLEEDEEEIISDGTEIQEDNEFNDEDLVEPEEETLISPPNFTSGWNLSYSKLPNEDLPRRSIMSAMVETAKSSARNWRVESSQRMDDVQDDDQVLLQEDDPENPTEPNSRDMYSHRSKPVTLYSFHESKPVPTPSGSSPKMDRNLKMKEVHSSQMMEIQTQRERIPANHVRISGNEEIEEESEFSNDEDHIEYYDNPVDDFVPEIIHENTT